MSATSTNSALDVILEQARAATHHLAESSAADRGAWLRAIADALEGRRDELVALAADETHLPNGRLNGELTRTTFQLRLMADCLAEGSWCEAIIDSADPDWPTGPRPELRRMLRPLGPVLVVAASNFPFAFSVVGGDTASALAVGCPVVLKANPGHPRLSALTAELTTQALARTGAPAGTFAVITDEDDTRRALADPRITAGSFTGSVRVGRLLYDIACSRPDPIPFYGELGSVNPAFVLPGMIRESREQLVKGFVGSATLGAGQFCTKPGLLFVPRTPGLLDEIAGAFAATGPAPLLNDSIARGYERQLSKISKQWQVKVAGESTGDGPKPSLLATDVAHAGDRLEVLFEECFGPAAVAVEYDEPSDLTTVIDQLPSQLTVTVHATDADQERSAGLLRLLARKAGRVVWNGWPTGVSVSWAMQHGGNWPATTASLHTSVGPTAMRRFLAPVCYQDVPHTLLPPELQDDNPLGIVRRVDGVLRV